MRRKWTAALAAALMAAVLVLSPSVDVRADETTDQTAESADQAAVDEAALAAAQAHLAALAVDLRGFLGQNPDTVAQNIGGFVPYTGLLEGSYYTDGAVEFWGTAEKGIRCIQIIGATSGNIAGVTYGTNFDEAVEILKAAGFTQMHTGGRRSSFVDGSGNLLSVGYDSNKAVFWVNYLKIY